MNPANQLTVSRIVLSFIFMGVLFSSLPFACTFALLLFVLAALTDMWDGQIARKRNLQTDFGSLMDPLADKILVSTAFISFVQIPGTGVHAWMVVLIISREFLLTGMRLLAMGKGVVIKAGVWGKHKTVSQMVAILLVLLFLSAKEFLKLSPERWGKWQFSFAHWQYGLAFWTMLVVVALTLVSGCVYARQNRALLWDGGKS